MPCVVLLASACGDGVVPVSDELSWLVNCKARLFLEFSDNGLFRTLSKLDSSFHNLGASAWMVAYQKFDKVISFPHDESHGLVDLFTTQSVAVGGGVLDRIQR